jgi:hypothetical protein
MDDVKPAPSGPTSAAAKKSRFTPFKWDDVLRLDEQLTEDERAIRDAAHSYCQEKLFPRVLEGNRHERFDREIMNEFGEMVFLARPWKATAAQGCPTSPTGSSRARSSGWTRVIAAPSRCSHRWSCTRSGLWIGGAEKQVSAEAANGRVRRLFRTDRAGRRFRSGLDAHTREVDRWGLRAERIEDLDHQLTDRRRVRGVGQDDAGDIRGFILERACRA